MEVDVFTRRDDYFALVNSPGFAVRWMLERHLAVRHQKESRFTLPGFCAPCSQVVDFDADFAYAWQAPDGVLIPNWRECLRCPSCRMNGRQRMVARLVAERIVDARKDALTVYMMEQVSPLYAWARAAFPWLDLIGSEYLGPTAVTPRAALDGVRHEDAEHLSFADASIDLLVSCDTFEHVNDPRQSFREVARVLRPGGHAVMTFPMDPHLDHNRRRAEIDDDGTVRALLPAIYHGNPLSRDGSLVVTDFGWEVLDDMRAAGLADPTLSVYWSYEDGYLGIQFYFAARKDQR